MNSNEYKASFLFMAPSSSSHGLIPNTAKLEMFTYSYSPIYRVSHLKFLESSVPWKNFLVCWDFDVQCIFFITERKKKQEALWATYLTRALGASGQYNNSGNKYSCPIKTLLPKPWKTCVLPWGALLDHNDEDTKLPRFLPGAVQQLKLLPS